MAVAHRNLSQVKLDIQKIISNIEVFEKGIPIETNLNDLKTNTEDLLRNLESLPLERLKTKLKKRQKRRKNRKLKKLKLKRNLELVDAKCDKLFYANPSNVTHKPVARSDQQRMATKDCQRFLKTFELLEQLHLERSQNPSETYKFSLKLRQLKQIWNSLLQDKLQEQISDDVKIQEQWNEALFGPSEKTYFEKEPNLQDFLGKRQIWDSYIDSRYGSSIPIGWIIPPLKVNEKWSRIWNLAHTILIDY